MGPYLAPSAIDFVHRHMYHSYFAPVQSGLFPPRRQTIDWTCAPWTVQHKKGLRKQPLVLFCSSRKQFFLTILNVHSWP